MKFIFQSILWLRQNMPKKWVRFVMFNSAFEVMTNYFKFLQLDR